MHTPSDPTLGNPARILVVDDEPKLTAALAEGLELEGWQVAAAGNARDALAACALGPFHVIVLDWMLPDLEGVDLVRQLRARGITSPVLMLTARGSLADRVTGFECGADDYLVKPFAFAELLARCRALYRRQRRTAPGPLRCGGIELDPHGRIARRGREEIPLTPREFDVLEYLISRRDQAVTREMLARDVWHEPAYTAALGNAINIHVTRLRQKLERDGQRLIRTQHGVGYCVAEPTVAPAAPVLPLPLRAAAFSA